MDERQSTKVHCRLGIYLTVSVLFIGIYLGSFVVIVEKSSVNVRLTMQGECRFFSFTDQYCCGEAEIILAKIYYQAFALSDLVGYEANHTPFLGYYPCPHKP